MEKEYLYRYVSFETLVGMVQKEALTFVLPSMWDDPWEELPFLQYLKETKQGMEYALFAAIYNKIYAQCWTELAESDAMWRIYSYNNRALRIKVAKDNISLLSEVDIVPVEYSDEPFSCEGKSAFLKSLAYKRIAFSHEKEVRLINRYLFKDEEDAELHVKAFLVIYEHEDRIKIVESLFPELEIDEKIKKIADLLNVGRSCKTTKDISYSHISNFIEGIMVHPLAPKWYVEIVKEFCRRNNVPFEGQSELYQIVE